MREYGKYIEDKYKEWNDKFEIPYMAEFQIKTMFELEEQFREQPKENVKTKRDILDMINKIYYSICRLKEKKIIFEEAPCFGCIFTSLVEGVGIRPHSIYTCIKPIHPRFREECNSENNWKHYIPISIYNKE